MRKTNITFEDLYQQLRALSPEDRKNHDLTVYDPNQDECWTVNMDLKVVNDDSSPSGVLDDGHPYLSFDLSQISCPSESYTENTETWYCWRELLTLKGEDKPRLITPWSDPKMYEYPYDLVFSTAKEAKDALKSILEENDGAEEDVKDWLLCKMTLKVVGCLE